MSAEAHKEARLEASARLLQMDVSPFKEIREELIKQNRLQDVQNVSIKVETREVKSADGEWESHEPTGRQLIHVILDQLVFVNDAQGVRLEQ